MTCAAYTRHGHCFLRHSKRLLNRQYSQKTSKWPVRVFSGIQPTGIPHLGNYFGAIKRWVELQSQYDVIYSIVDLHSITLPQDPKVLQESIYLMTASLLACGLDPSKCILFQQSKVPYHANLGWILGTLTTMTRLYHFPQYKEKSSSLKDIPLGLFTYPVLQAADILLYKSTLVPVGEDQVQHLNLAQHLTHTFNNRFGTVFPFPEVLVGSGQQSGRIKSLREPDKKMSKSHVDPKSRVELTDSPSTIVSKLKKAVTDFTSAVTYDPEGRPGVSNLIELHSLATGLTPEEICEEHSMIDTGKYKLVVADVLVNLISPIREEILRLNSDRPYLTTVLEEGNKKACQIAERTWGEVCDCVGITPNLKNKKQHKSAVVK